VTDLRVHPQAQPLTGGVPVPSDKSIGHRALLIAALASGASTIRGAAFGDDNRATMDALSAMGVVFANERDAIVVQGRGLHGLSAPRGPLDCGNSGTTMRLLAGVLAGQTFSARLSGDASLSRRPMRRVVEPLQRRGARIEGRAHPTEPGEILPPLDVSGLPDDRYLEALELETSVASAQVKSAALLSGLFAHGVTVVREPSISRDHTERMLASAGVPIQRVGSLVALDPAGWDGRIAPFDLRIAGDLSAAAFLLAAAQIVPGSRVTVRDVGQNPTRTGFLEIARDMGAGLGVEPRGDEGGEPIGQIHAWHPPLPAARVAGALLVRAIDVVPIVCARAARARGTTVIRDAQELRVKESDRLQTMARVLRAFGVVCEELSDGMRIEGRDGPLEAADVDSGGDHRVAMTATVLALASGGVSTVRDVDCVRTSFPRFVGTLRALGARIEVVAAAGGMH
jgi:3-phosphoshikimate 1-carboxyvinyltransferase